MKRFSRFITELFDRKIPVWAWDTGGSTESYLFYLIRNPDTGRLDVAPQKHDLTAFVDHWILKHGLETVDHRASTQEGIDRLNSTAPSYAYLVSFHNIKTDMPFAYAELQLMSDGDLKDNVWEISFTMHRAKIETRTMGRASALGKYTYKWTDSTDEDINQFSGADAAMILGGVVDAARDFYKRKKPRGFIVGTKPTANPARGRIYKTLARMAGREFGAEVTEVEEARQGMKDAAVIWFDRSNPFRLAGLP